MPSSAASRARIEAHWQVLCHEIGHRYAGTSGEQQAADYIESQLRRLKLDNVSQQPFEFPNWKFSKCTLRVGKNRPTRRIATARPMAYSVGTSHAKRAAGSAGVRGRLAYLQSGLPSDFDQPLRGKIGLLVGSLALGDESVKNRVVRSGLKALLAVDARIPFGWTTSNGAAPQWMSDYRVPTAGVAYMDAVRMVEQMPLNANLVINARTFPSMSENVIGEVRGTDRPEQVIVVSAHHDCVWGNVGADDNGSGVIFILELARIFARRRPRRTIRFISYGVEERLSVGAYLYMRSLTPTQRKEIALVINADAIATAIGTDVLHVTGTPALEKLARQIWSRRKHPVDLRRTVNPYSDHFPLNIAGVPSLWLSRPSILTDGYWQLHSEHDNTDHVSPTVLARTIDTAAILLDRVAKAPRLPIRRQIEPAVYRQVRQVARREYRHPWSPQMFNYDR